LLLVGVVLGSVLLMAGSPNSAGRTFAGALALLGTLLFLGLLGCGAILMLGARSRVQRRLPREE
jgi:hypothetical protein